MTQDVTAGAARPTAQSVESAELQRRIRAWISELAREVDDLWVQMQSGDAGDGMMLRWPEGGGDFEEMYARLESAVEARGFMVLHEALGDRLGTCDRNGLICLHSDLSAADRCTTLFHELTHQLGQHDDDLLADVVAYCIARYLGIPCPNTPVYLVSQGFGAEALRETEISSTVCAAVELVMETLGWPTPTSPTSPTG